MDSDIQTKKTSAARARSTRKLILQHKRRMRLLKEEKAALHAAIRQGKTSAPPVFSDVRKCTPLGDITSAFLNQNNARRNSNPNANSSTNQTKHNIQRTRRLVGQTYQVNLAKKFDAVNFYTYGSSECNNVGTSSPKPPHSQSNGSCGSSSASPECSANASKRKQSVLLNDHRPTNTEHTSPTSEDDAFDSGPDEYVSESGSEIDDDIYDPSANELQGITISSG
ncbi:hypothetical protein P8452_23017 [Trifolium repens]|nr:hypothetical protein P8452_23017 [Trifolium repens]